jgi:hypothetical protein
MTDEDSLCFWKGCRCKQMMRQGVQTAAARNRTGQRTQGLMRAPGYSKSHHPTRCRGAQKIEKASPNTNPLPRLHLDAHPPLQQRRQRDAAAIRHAPERQRQMLQPLQLGQPAALGRPERRARRGRSARAARGAGGVRSTRGAGRRGRRRGPAALWVAMGPAGWLLIGWRGGVVSCLRYSLLQCRDLLARKQRVQRDRDSHARTVVADRGDIQLLQPGQPARDQPQPLRPEPRPRGVQPLEPAQPRQRARVGGRPEAAVERDVEARQGGEAGANGKHCFWADHRAGDREVAQLDQAAEGAHALAGGWVRRVEMRRLCVLRGAWGLSNSPVAIPHQAATTWPTDTAAHLCAHEAAPPQVQDLQGAQAHQAARPQGTDAAAVELELPGFGVGLSDCRVLKLPPTPP